MSAAAGGDTIFALSSGAPPAAISIIRVSGPGARIGLAMLAGRLPAPRRATLRSVRDPRDGALLDRAMLLWFPGPHTATGEDVAEFHCHGGRAVVAAVLRALGRIPGLRLAEPGEFTRRALENGRVDLAQAEGLADLLVAETEMQRRTAIAGFEGGLARMIADWRGRLIDILAAIEADIEYSEDDETIATIDVGAAIDDLIASVKRATAAAPAERIRDGISVVIAGPPNAGKSTLMNALTGRDAALVSEIPGTTRDIVEAAVTLDGLPLRLCDTAGLRDSDDRIETMGMAAARGRIDTADVLLWLGDRESAPTHATMIVVASKADVIPAPADADVAVAPPTGFQIALLRTMIAERVDQSARVDGFMLNTRHQAYAGAVLGELEELRSAGDPLLMAELLRDVIRSADAFVDGRASESMLDALFSRFCIGK